MIDEIENMLRYISKQLNAKNLTLTVHPFVHAYLTKGFFSIHRKWNGKYGKIKLNRSDAYQFLEYRFFKGEEEIHLK